MRWAYAALLCLAAGVGCKADRTFTCAESSDCVRAGTEGQCLLPGYCAFSDSSCDSGQRWDTTAEDTLSGSRVSSSDGGPDETNECGGRTVLAGAVGESCGVCQTGGLICDGTDALVCAGEFDNEGEMVNESTAASSVFNGDLEMWRSGLAVDDMPETSWFSDGVEANGLSTFEWRGVAEECIGRIEVTGNQGHANPDFRDGYGFGKVTVSVIDAFSQVIFTEEVDLPADDDDFTLDIGVRGRVVVLDFEMPDDPTCGGFAELDVFALRE